MISEQTSQYNQTTSIDYQIDQIVWAKIKGYPWWPAQIFSFEKLSNDTFISVNFIGHKSHAELKQNCIEDF